MVYAKGPKIDTLYHLIASDVVGHSLVNATKLPNISLWHGRLGHISVKGMETLAHFGYLPLYKFADLSKCDHCIYGRQTQGPHSKHLSLKSSPMDLLHTDVCEMPQLSLGGARYMVTFIDDATRKVWAYPLRLKSEVFGIFQRFLAMVL